MLINGLSSSAKDEYCMYLRKSRADQEAEARGEGETLARHEKILLQLARKLNINITEIYREGIMSGETIASRPVVQQLLSEVEAGRWKGVLVVEVERLARGETIDQGIVAQAFKYSGTRIITPIKIYDPNNEYDEEYFEFGLFMSRREYKTTNRRLQRGRLSSVREGKYVGSKPPYGYDRKKLDREKGYTLEINKEQGDIVKMIFTLYAYGEQLEDGSLMSFGPSLIAKRLNALKVAPLKGQAWSPASIRDMLRNPVYIGKIRWNCRPTNKRIVDGKMTKERPRADLQDTILVEGLHEAIIDDVTWCVVQDKISLSHKPTPIPNKQSIKSPLAGLVVCGVCGRRMVRRPYPGDASDVLMCPVSGCKNTSSHLHLVEDHLIKALEKWLNDYRMDWHQNENIDISNDTIDIKRKALKKLEIEMQNIRKQTDNLHNLLEQGVYDVDTFLERSRQLKERITEAQRDYDTLAESLQLEELQKETHRIIIPKVERVLELYSTTTDPGNKNALLKEVLDKVVYLKETGGRWSGKIDDFQLSLYPRLPHRSI